MVLRQSGTATDKSDIDLCVIMDFDDKRAILTDMYLNIESNKPFDLIIYSETEWKECLDDRASFAYLISKKGVELYNGQQKA